MEHDALISEYSHEKHRLREGDALFMLKKIASIVKPIMRQRMWRVGTLAEFYPDQLNLLGLNVGKGRKICLRLRHPYDDRQFLDLGDVVDTMLHELCHIVYGPHDQIFQNLWNQLRDEHERLIMKGYTGEGFLSTGYKVGGSRIPLEEARRRARLASAQQRRLQQSNGGNRLGGYGPSRGEDIRAVIADAAQRRTKITKGCASDSQDFGWKEKIADDVSKNGFKTRAEEDDANEKAIMQAYIELIQEEEREKYGQSYVPPSQDNPAGSRNAEAKDAVSLDMPPPPIPVSSKPKSQMNNTEGKAPSGSPKDMSSSRTAASPSLSYNEAWDCDICTMNNPPTYLCCDGCGTERPEPVKQMDICTSASQPLSLKEKPSSRPKAKDTIQRKSSLQNIAKFAQAASAAEQKKPLGWCCYSCGTFMENQWWTCSSCGAMKLSS